MVMWQITKKRPRVKHGALASAPVAEAAPATGAGANRGFIAGSAD